MSSDECPACGHPASVHPQVRGGFLCGRSLNDLPSCRECAEPLKQLRKMKVGE